MHTFGSVPIGPLHVQASVTHHPLPEAILHSCYVIHMKKSIGSSKIIKGYLTSVVVKEMSKKMYKDVFSDPEPARTISQWFQL